MHGHNWIPCGRTVEGKQLSFAESFTVSLAPWTHFETCPAQILAQAKVGLSGQAPFVCFFFNPICVSLVWSLWCLRLPCWIWLSLGCSLWVHWDRCRCSGGRLLSAGRFQRFPSVMVAPLFPWPFSVAFCVRSPRRRCSLVSHWLSWLARRLLWHCRAVFSHQRVLGFAFVVVGPSCHIVRMSVGGRLP